MARMTSWREWTGTPRGTTLAALVVSAAAMTAASFAAPLRLSPRYFREADGTQVEREARMAKNYYFNAWLGARRVQLRDSLRALARPGLVVRIDRQLDATATTRLERRIRLAWAAFDVDAPLVPVVLAGIGARGNEPFTVSSFAALPATATEPCLVVVSTRDLLATKDTDDQVARDARRIRDIMFGCALYARHGLPGAAVSAELRRIAWTPVPLRFAGSGFPWWRGESTLEHGQYSAPRFLPYVACVGGRVSDCVGWPDLFSARVREKPAFVSSTPGFEGVYVMGRPLLALLRASLPPGEFEALWRDERPFDEALSAITGRRHDDWVHQVVLRGTRPLVSSFSPVSPVITRALLWFALAAITGVTLQTRRTITD